MNFNSEIEQIFKGYELNGKKIPVRFMYYNGDQNTYLVYANESNGGDLYGDGSLLGYFAYYDISIYSKTDYTGLMTDVIRKMEEAGWTWIPSRSSPDLYEQDTGLFHKALSFSKEYERED